MTFSFDKVIEREDTNSAKWNYRKDIFGTDNVLPLWVADMDFACPRGVTEAIMERAKHPIYGYPGKPETYSQAIIHWLDKRFGLAVEPDWLHPLPGVVAGLHIAVDAFTKPGDKVVIQPPVYHPFFHSVENRGRHVVENPLMEHNGYYTMDLEDLKEKIDDRTRMLILCSPHNPVGRVWTKEELLALAEICIDKDVLILADEIHSDLVFEKGSFIPFFSLPDEVTAHGMAFIAPSKTFNLAGLFSSVVIAKNDKIRQEFLRAAGKTGAMNVNVFGIEALIAAYNHGEDWLEELLPYLEGNARYMSDFLMKHIPEVKMQVPEATYLGWMDFRKLGLFGAKLKNFTIQKARLGLNVGEIFGKQGDGFARINFGCPRPILEEAMNRLEEAVKDYR